MVYGVLAVILLITWPLMIRRPYCYSPLGVLPVFEGLAFFLNRKPSEVRPIVVALAVIFAIIIRAW